MVSQIISESGHRLLTVIKDLPFWLLSGITIIGLVSICAPLDISIPFRPWWPFITMAAAILAISKGCAIQFVKYKATAKLKKTFHLTPCEHSYWSSNKQPDGSFVTQLIAVFNVMNCANFPVSLTGATIKGFFFRKELIQSQIHLDTSKLRRFSTDIISQDTIPVGETLPMQLMLLFYGNVPRTAIEMNFKTKICIFDSAGNKQTVQVNFKSTCKPKKAEQKAPLEIPSLLNDPIEKEIVSILQLELKHYSRCGRSAGGLGSIYINIPGQAFQGVGCDSWYPNSPENQYINTNPEAAILKSDNLDTLIVLNQRLTSKNEKERYKEYLINRIDESHGYLSISYFIVCILWKLGYLHEALNKVKSSLPQGETREFGFSNVLRLLNGLLRHRHPDFTTESLDFIEQFIFGLNEHTFSIIEKIATIRALRLRENILG